MASEQAIQLMPKEVTCGPYCWTVSFDADECHHYDYLGVAHFRTARIKLEPRLSDTQLPQTLMHEILHALGHVYEIKEWSDHTKNDKGEHTDKIDLMATAILQFIRANPSVIEWMCKQR